ncbi:hypothetical protein MJO28_017324 [Puccinia striiformis f. sp. tritici]|nr:hypothetical protein MJO28_017324 [Puccinia striiformis f. sp. tritici]
MVEHIFLPVCHHKADQPIYSAHQLNIRNLAQVYWINDNLIAQNCPSSTRSSNLQLIRRRVSKP